MYYQTLRLKKVARIELLFKIEVVCARISFFNNSNFFKCQETENVLHFDFSGI